MRIIQIAHALTLYDGASKFVMKLDVMFNKLGYKTAIFAHKLDEKIARQKAESGLGAVPKAMGDFDGGPEDIVIYHMTTGTSFNKWVAKYPHKIVLYYHNITPAKYFFGNAWGSFFKCIRGRRQLDSIVKNSFFAWGASEYSCQELRALGMEHVKELPPIVEPEKFLGRKPIPEITEKYNDGRINILFVGRGVPHKKQDEAIEAIRWYREHIGRDIRLILVGNAKKSFGEKLHKMVEKYNLQDDVVFTGGVTDDELCSWYQVSTALLCLSEHEGFCVPLVEAMLFDKPVIAYATSAVPETVGEAGVLITDKSPENIARTIENTLKDEELLTHMAQGRKKRLRELSYDTIFAQVAQDIKEIERIK